MKQQTLCGARPQFSDLAAAGREAQCPAPSNDPPQTRRGLLLPLLLAALALGLASGCAVKPLRPGASSSGSTGWAGSHTNALTQSENPDRSSTQKITRRDSMEVPVAAGSEITLPGAPGGEGARVRMAEGSVVKLVKEETSDVSLGAAQKDVARELGAKLAATRPAVWVGILCVLAGGALLWFGWPTPALIAAGTGVGLMLFAQMVATHTGLLAVLGIAGVAIFAVFRAYERGALDRVLPDALDKNPGLTRRREGAKAGEEAVA